MNRLAAELEKQLSEALGAVNKWYCSEYYGYEVTDAEILLGYYIKHGGAAHFRKTYGAGQRECQQQFVS